MARSRSAVVVESSAEAMYERVHDRAWRLARAATVDEDAASAIVARCFAEHAPGGDWHDDLAILRRIRSCLRASGAPGFADPAEEVLRLAFLGGFDQATIAAIIGQGAADVQRLVWDHVRSAREGATVA